MLKNIIISRTDGIGDVILTLPVAGLLKKVYPNVTIWFIGRSYTAPVIAACEHVDEFINRDNLEPMTERQQIDLLQQSLADAIVHVFPDKFIARLAKRSGIPIRIGTSHRFHHWFTCNKLVHEGRKRSPLHEAELNVRLLRPLGIQPPVSRAELVPLTGLTRPEPLEPQYEALLDPHRFNLILHPTSKGSAREWGVNNYSELIQLLPQERYKVFVSGSAEEGARLLQHPKLWQHGATNITGAMPLDQFIAFIARADGLIAASTGPLHIAAALGKVALGIYAPMRPIHPGRWCPLGPRAGFLVRDKQCQLCRHDNHCACMESITPVEVCARLEQLIVTDGK